MVSPLLKDTGEEALVEELLFEGRRFRSFATLDCVLLVQTPEQVLLKPAELQKAEESLREAVRKHRAAEAERKRKAAEAEGGTAGADGRSDGRADEPVVPWDEDAAGELGWDRFASDHFPSRE